MQPNDHDDDIMMDPTPSMAASDEEALPRLSHVLDPSVSGAFSKDPGAAAFSQFRASLQTSEAAFDWELRHLAWAARRRQAEGDDESLRVFETLAAMACGGRMQRPHRRRAAAAALALFLDGL